MPSYVGQAVLKRMDTQALAVGPVISHPRSKRWTFLARPNVADYREVFAGLYRLDSTLAPTGAQVALPSPAEQASALRVWVRPPTSTYLPLATVVVDCLHRAAPRRQS
jgi:hypothetical protein